jgi:hypothetical protein
MAKNQKPKVLAFLQSGLGLILISATFFVAGYLYNDYRKGSEKDQAERVELERVKAELRSRIAQWQIYCSDALMDKFKNNTTPLNDLLLRPPSSEDQSTPMYPLHNEYKDLALTSVLAKGASLSKDTAERAQFEKPINNLPNNRTGGQIFQRRLWDVCRQFVIQTGLLVFAPTTPGPPFNMRVVPK